METKTRGQLIGQGEPGTSAVRFIRSKLEDIAVEISEKVQIIQNILGVFRRKKVKGVPPCGSV